MIEARLTLDECAELDELLGAGFATRLPTDARRQELFERAVLFGRDDVVERPFLGLEPK